MISEYYQLRRTAAKDVAAYIGFLIGFIGSAPFAWGLLATQLDAGRFARGLWYFFGIVTTAGIFAGIAGLGIGAAGGLLWEQIHRHRRQARLDKLEPGAAASAVIPEVTLSDPPRLQLVSTGGSRAVSGSGRVSVTPGPRRLESERPTLAIMQPMRDVTVRLAETRDVPALSALMREFYAESNFPLTDDAASRAFLALIGDPDLGRAWVIDHDGEAAGFAVLTTAFSMEYGGLRGFVDDLFVVPSQRGKGLATAALAEIRRVCVTLGVRALLVETSDADDAARRVYRAAGFVDSGHMIMSIPLAPAVHET